MESLATIFDALFRFFDARYTYWAAFLLPFIAIIPITKRAFTQSEAAQNAIEWLTAYHVLTAPLLVNLLENTFSEALLLLENFPDSPFFAVFFVLSNILYVAAYGYSLYRLLLFLPGGLLLTEIVLLLFPFFITFFPFFAHAFCSFMAGEEYLLRIHLANRNIDCRIFIIWSGFWLLYFLFSPTINKTWKIIEERQINKNK